VGVQFKEHRSSSPSGSVDTPGLLAPSLPPQIIDHVTERVCLVSIIVATLTMVLVGLAYWLDTDFRVASEKPLFRLATLALVFSSLALFVVQRTGLLTRQHIVNLALVYQVIVGFCVGVLENATPWYGDAPVRGMSFLGVWFFLSAFLLPNAPLRMAIAAVLSVLGWLLAYRLSITWSGIPPYPQAQLTLILAQIAVTGGWMLAINRQTLASQVQQYKAEQLGAYQLESIIGSGGMGEVWKARHKLLARDAAVKLIRPDVLRASTGREEASLLKRFEREARSTASLRSPNTVALYDYGQTQDGTLYYVMELLNGIDLQPRGPCPQYSDPGLRVSGRSASGGSGTSRHQAEEHRTGEAGVAV
jgi:serine/threonine-protein kinase